MRKAFVISGVVTLAIGALVSYIQLWNIVAGIPVVILGICLTLAGFWMRFRPKHVAITAPSAMLLYEAILWITITVIVKPYF